MAGKFYFSNLLTRFSIQRGIGESGVGLQLAPRVNHNQIIGQYFERDRTRFGHVPVKRAPGENTKVSNTGEGEMKPFILTDRSIIKKVPMEYVEGMGNQALFQELEQATIEAVQEIEHALETDVHNLLWDTTQSGFNSKYTADKVVVPSTKWNATGGKMYNDVRGLADKIYKACGYYPNTMVMPTEVLDTIAGDTGNEISERIKYTRGDVPDTALLARYFKVQNVIVPRNLDDTTNIGQAASYDFMWKGDNIMLAYVNPADTRKKVTLASLFTMENARRPFLGTFRRYNEENDSHEVKVGAFWQEKVIDNACAGVLFDVLT